MSKKKRTSAEVQRRIRDIELVAHEKELLSAYVPYVQQMQMLQGKSTMVVQKPSKKVKKSRSSKTCRVASKDFLKTFEWRKLRMQALVLYGNKCMCCGTSPSTGGVVNVDHIKPRKLFPELALELTNLQILCSACNHGKGNWNSTDWRNKTLKESLMDTTPC